MGCDPQTLYGSIEATPLALDKPEDEFKVVLDVELDGLRIEMLKEYRRRNDIGAAAWASENA